MLARLAAVRDEKAELDSRLGRLLDYISGPHFSYLSQTQQVLMRRQVEAMQAYSSVLAARAEAMGRHD